MLAYFRSIDYKSLKTILIVAFLVRLISVIFAEGYGMHDDHYLIIEAAGSWVDGYDYNHWLPWTEGNLGVPEGHSFTYVGINYLLISGIKSIGISDPKIIMLIIRLIHAVFSLLIIRYAFKITEKLSTKAIASTVGWILALLWVMPFLSVRNLVEVTSIPFLMASMWFVIRDNKKTTLFYAGLLIGMAISFRYQIAVFAVGMGIYFILKMQWEKLIFFTVGALVCFSLTQGLVDYFIWGRPFAEFRGYVEYNMNEGTQYMKNSNYFMYFYVLFGFLLFPMGILALIGYFNSAKKYLIIFLPTLLFLLFHTWFPNRQERFILTIFPLVICLSVMGIALLRERKFWNGFWKVSLVAFWILNIPLLAVVSTMPSKKSRMDTMYSLYGHVKGNEHILIEATGETNPEMMPFFYSGKWRYGIQERWSTDTTSIDTICKVKHDLIFFFGQDSLKERIHSFKKFYPNMKLHAQIQPGYVDKLLHSINPRNSNSYVEVWWTNYKK
ncbi:MAG: glycosyltransferase family 39 protein [Fluviicola sp.]